MRSRSTPEPDNHSFIIQDNGSAAKEKADFYFVHLPSLYIAGGGYQLIFKAHLSSDSLNRYRRIKAGDPEKIYVLHNKTKKTIDDLFSKDSFEGYISDLDGR